MRTTQKSLFAMTGCAVLSISLTMLGCGKDDDKDDDDKATSELDGTWATTCYAENDEDGKAESYNKSTVTISGTSATEVINQYPATDTACAGTPNFTFDITATITIGKDVTTPAGAKELDLTPTKVTATVKTAEMVKIFNDTSMCGATDWVLNTARDITTGTCANDGGKNNDPEYDIYDVDGTTLKFGDKDAEGAGSTAAKRPTAYSKTDVYTKQ